MVTRNRRATIAAAAALVLTLPIGARAEPYRGGCSVVVTGAPGTATYCQFTSDGLPHRFVILASGWSVVIEPGTPRERMLMSSGPDCPRLGPIVLSMCLRTGEYRVPAGRIVRMSVGTTTGLQDGIMTARSVPEDQAQPVVITAVGTESDPFYLPADQGSQPYTGVDVWQGKPVTFANLADARHSMSCASCGFDSGIIDPGGMVDVDGIEDLDPGLYSFTCRVNSNMSGYITVH